MKESTKIFLMNLGLKWLKQLIILNLKAARLRDRITAVERILENQIVYTSAIEDMDVLAFAQDAYNT